MLQRQSPAQRDVGRFCSQGNTFPAPSGDETAEILLLNLRVRSLLLPSGASPKRARRPPLAPDAFPSGYPAPRGLVLPEQTVRVRLNPANKGCMCFSSH